jgi:AcrR family transcriptional regulator
MVNAPAQKPQGRRGRKIESARKEILAGAAHLFLQRGFNDVTMEQIAGAVGLTPGALYYYFASKDEIFECLDQQVAAEFAGIVGELDGRQAPLREALRDVCRRIGAHAAANRDLFVFLVKTFFSIDAETRDRLQRRRVQFHHELQERLRGLFAAARARGETRDLPPEDLVLFLEGVVHWACASWCLSGADAAGLGGKLETLLDIFFDGAAPRAAGERPIAKGRYRTKTAVKGSRR